MTQQLPTSTPYIPYRWDVKRGYEHPSRFLREHEHEPTRALIYVHLTGNNMYSSYVLGMILDVV